MITGITTFIINLVIIRTDTVKQTGGTGSNSKAETFAVVIGRVGKFIIKTKAAPNLLFFSSIYNKLDAGEFIR